jgi:hypothetical protein
LQKTRRFKTHLYKHCPRCRGDLLADKESFAEETSAAEVVYVCLQCGRSTQLSTLIAAVKPLRPTSAVGAAA